MQSAPSDILDPAEASSAGKVYPFGANEMRLSAREWIIALLIVAAAVLIIPRAWKTYEPWTIGPDYRIPDALSHDYWLYQRRLERSAEPGTIPILGDSVVWGEYVRADGTLSHFLDQQAGAPGRFLNCGMDGLCPLAMESLVKSYGDALRDRKVIVQCNLLWMSTHRADFSSVSEDAPISHPRLLPQFFPRIPAYRADANQRFSAMIEPHSAFLSWASHLQNAYFDNLSPLDWTTRADLNDPNVLPNAWRNPLPRLEAGVPGEPANDPQRGPSSKRHRPWIRIKWSGLGIPGVEADRAHFEEVELEASRQWRAFGRLIQFLRGRRNDVLIIVGPFNEHMIAPDDQDNYWRLREAAVKSLQQEGWPVIRAEVLPINLYADASHPLTEGYALLAARIYQHPVFQRWLAH